MSSHLRARVKIAVRQCSEMGPASRPRVQVNGTPSNSQGAHMSAPVPMNCTHFTRAGQPAGFGALLRASSGPFGQIHRTSALAAALSRSSPSGWMETPVASRTSASVAVPSMLATTTWRLSVIR